MTTTASQPDLLSGIAPADALTILALGKAVTTAAGDVLFNIGDPAEDVYLVRRGRVSLTLPLRIGGGEEDVFIEERLPSQTLGWSALIPPYRFTLKAATPLETELVALPRAPLFQYFQARPDIGYLAALNLAAVIGQRLQVVQAMWLREMQRLVDARA